MADSLTNFVTVGPSITGRSCMGVIIYAHLSQSASVCNSLLAAFIGIANQCPSTLYLNSLWNHPSIWTTISLLFFFFTPFSSRHAHPTLSPSAPSLYWVVCLPTGLQIQPALVPGHWAKASLDRMRRKDGGKGGGEEVKGVQRATTLEVNSDLWVVSATGSTWRPLWSLQMMLVRGEGGVM